MKNKRNSERDDYRLLKNKLLIRTFGMLFFAFAFLAALYSLFLKGHIADTFVGFLDNFVYHDYDRAYNVYSIYIRDYMSLFFVVLSLLLFAIILRFYLNEFSKYFKEINRSIDALIEENSGDIVLPSELTAIEKKINHIKHTLEQRKLAAELSEQRKNDLVVYLAHDLKTPLTSVIGYLTLLRDENKISEELREKYLSISLEKAEHLEDLINEFFEITRFNLSNITLEYSRVNLTRMLEQLTYEFKPMFLEKNLKCELEIAPDTMIKCDVNKMQRVFDNLLRNAVNYSFDDSTIHITVKQNGENLPKGTDATVSEGWCDLQVRNDTDNTFQIEVAFDESNIYGRIYTAEPVTKEYSIYNSSVTYVRQNGKIFQMAEVCRTETDTISGKTMKHLLYTNKCEITYLLPEGMEVQEK